MNKQLAELHSGYQDLMDRYGMDDPLVQGMKAAIDRHELRGRDGLLAERRNPLSPSGIWNRVSTGTEPKARR